MWYLTKKDKTNFFNDVESELFVKEILVKEKNSIVNCVIGVHYKDLQKQSYYDLLF